MSEKTELKARGIVRPKGAAWLKGVQADAARNTISHITRQLEKKEQLVQKARGLSVEEMTEAAKRKLNQMSTFEPREGRELSDGEDNEELDDEFDDDEEGSFDTEGTGEESGDVDETEVKPMVKPFANLNKEELLEVAAKEGVEVPEGATNPQLRELIKAKRGEAK